MKKTDLNVIKQNSTETINKASSVISEIVFDRDNSILLNLPIKPFVFRSRPEKQGAFMFEVTRTPESNCGGAYGYSTPTTYYFDTTLASLIEAREQMMALISCIDNIMNVTLHGNGDIHYNSLRAQIKSDMTIVEYEYRNFDENSEDYDEDMSLKSCYPVFVKGISELGCGGYKTADMQVVLSVLSLFRQFELIRYALNPKHGFLSTLKGALIGDNYISSITERKAQRVLDAAESIKSVFCETLEKKDDLFNN